MAMFPCDLTEDPVLARSDRLIRWGAVIPWFGLAVIGLTGWLLRPSTATFVKEMLVLCTVGQVLVWFGMDGMRRCRGWAFDGVLFYIWFGGVVGAAALGSTGVMVLAPVAFVAPLVATAARWRMRHDAKHAGVAR
jgi:hypothetical protein